MLKASETAVSVMTPLHDPMDSLDVLSIGSLSVDADYHVSVFSVLDVKAQRMARLKFADAKAPDATIRCGRRNGMPTLEFDRRRVDEAIRQGLSA
jgi:hypothetical protein